MGQPESRPHVEPSKQQSWARQSRAVGVYGWGLGKRRPKGPTARHNALRPMPVTMPRPRGVAARSIWSAVQALDRAAAATAASSTTAPCPYLSTHCVAVMLSTPANHNHPVDRLPGARVAASCTSSLNLLENQGDR
jgi:hypothetical protein